MYKRLENPSEEDINKLLEEEFILHSISVIPGQGAFAPGLIYHFIKYKEVKFSPILPLNNANNIKFPPSTLI